MNSAIRKILAQSILALIVMTILIGPVTQKLQADTMQAQMAAFDLIKVSEDAANERHPCQNCFEKDNKNTCESTCLPFSAAILSPDPLQATRKSNQPPQDRSASVLEYTPGLEPTPPRA